MNWKQAFNAVNTALGVIAGAGDIPGVNLIPYVSVVSSAAKAIKMGLNAAVNVAPYVEAVRETFADGLPTPEKLSALDAKIGELRALVNAPLPPREDGESE